MSPIVQALDKTAERLLQEIYFLHPAAVDT